MSKRDIALRYEPSPQALRAIADELRAVGVELDSPSIRRALSAALEIEGPRLEQMAREDAEAEIRSLRAAHQDALRILLEASGAEVRSVGPRASAPVQAPTVQMPAVAPPPAPPAAPADPFDEPVLTPRDAVARRRPATPREPAHSHPPAAPAPAATAAPASPGLTVPPNANLTDLVRQRLGDEAPADHTPPPRDRDRDDEPKRPIFRRGRRG